MALIRERSEIHDDLPVSFLRYWENKRSEDLGHVAVGDALQ